MKTQIIFGCLQKNIRPIINDIDDICKNCVGEHQFGWHNLCNDKHCKRSNNRQHMFERKYGDYTTLIYKTDSFRFAVENITEHPKDKENLGVIITGYADDNYSPPDKKLIIPNQILGLNVIGISDYAFVDSELQSITIPPSLKRIGISAFRNNKLTHIKLPANIKHIGFKAFAQNNLKEVFIPNTEAEYHHAFDMKTKKIIIN